MTTPTCSVNDCANPARCRGYCNAHYQQFKKYGQITGPVRPTRSTPCSVEGCGKPIQGRGLCHQHRRRLERHGSPLLVAVDVRRLRTEKACSRCGEVKPLDAFVKHNRNADGRQAYCTECFNAGRRATWPDRRESDIARLREWRKTPAGKVSRRRDYEQSRERIIKRATAWNRAHPEVRREATRRRRAKLGSKGSIAGVTRAQLAARRAYYGNQCWMCGAPAEHMDHVKPLAAGGPNLASNLRPACAACNRAKSDAWPFDTRRHFAVNVEVARRAIAQVNVGEFDERRFAIALRRAA